MKRFFAFAGLMTAAVISLTNCQPKEIEVDAAASGNIFSLTASAPGTKTTNSDLSTLWAQDDELAVFYSDGKGYTSLGAVPIVDGVGTSSGKFELSSPTTLPSQADWYILYPYYELHDNSTGDIYNQLNTPAAHTGDGWMYFGNRKGLTQSGMDNKEHLAGQHMPMYAVQKAGGPSMSVTMKHLTSVVEFNLKNSTGAGITVASVTLDASEPVVGCFCVDLTAEPAAFEAHTATSVASKAVINVENGTLPSGGMGLVYLPIKPYTQDLSTPLKVTVAYTGEAAGTFVKEFTLTQAQAVFEPGKIKKVTIDITAGGSSSGDTVADAQSDAGSYTISEAQVTAVVGSNMFVTDNTGTILVYSSNASNFKVGDYVSVSGDTKAWNNLMEFNNPTVVKVKDGSYTPSPATWTDSQMAAAYGNAQVAYVTYQAEFSANRNGIIPGSDAVLYTTNPSGVSQAKGKTYKVTGYVYGWTDYVKNEVTTKEVCMFVVSQEEVTGGGTNPGGDTEPKLSLGVYTVAFDAEPSGSQEVKVNCDNTDWSVSGAPAWLSVTEDKDNSKIVLTAQSNTSADARSAQLTVTHGELSKTLTVNQAGKSSGGSGSKTVKLTNEDIFNAGEAANGYQEWTIKAAAGQTYHAYAIKNKHSNATSDKHCLQIKKYASDTAYYIQVPEIGSQIMSITMTVSSTSKPMDGGNNAATLFFSSSNSTSAAGDGVASAVGASTVTIDTSSLNLNTGFITASGAVRIWDIEISYN